MEYDILINNINSIHTTEMGINRIKNNLHINDEVISYCKKIILNPKTNIYRKGKNYYCELDNIRLIINAYSYTIITAHLIK
jgi:hypothetical protein